MNSFQHTLRTHVSLRDSAEANRFWQRQIDYLTGVVQARQQERAQPDPGRAEELVAEVLSELITRAWRTFRGESEQELRGFLRGILLHREAEGRRREQIEADAKHYAAQDHADPAAAEDPALWDRDSPEPRDLTLDDLRFLAQLTANDLCQRKVARELGTSDATVSRRYARLRREVSALPEEERDRLEAWLRRGL